MTETVFLILYGLSFIGGVALTAVWGRVAWLGYKSNPKPDQFSLIATGLTVGALANVIIFGTRTWTSLRYGIEGTVIVQNGAWFIILGLLALALSKGILMWAHDLSHRSLSWRMFALVSCLWIIGAPLWLLWRSV